MKNICNKRFASLFLSVLALATLGSCSQGESGSSSENTGNESNQSSESISNDNRITKEMFNHFCADAITFRGEIVRVSRDAKSIYQADISFSDGKYFFQDKIAPYGIPQTNIKIFRGEKGYAVTKSLNLNNEVETENIYSEATGKQVSFDLKYGNPFTYISYEDLVYSEENQTYSFNNDASENLFFAPLSFYVETVSSMELKYLPESKEFEVTYSAYTDEYTSKAEGVISFCEELTDVVPYTNESYTPDVEAALSKLNSQKNYTYKVTRTDPTGQHETETLETYYTDSVIMYPSDSFTSREVPYGTALFNDGKVYDYEVIDEKVVKGVESEFLRPNYECATFAVYRQVSENIYVVEDEVLAVNIAAYFANTIDEISLLSFFGIQGPFTLVIEDQTLKSFSYTTTRIYENEIVQDQLVEVVIQDVGTTKIDENLKFEI